MGLAIWALHTENWFYVMKSNYLIEMDKYGSSWNKLSKPMEFKTPAPELYVNVIVCTLGIVTYAETP